MFDQRDVLFKAFPRKNYLISSDNQSIHLLARLSTEHESKPQGAVPGFTRATWGLGGYKVESAPEINGSKYTIIT